MPEVFQKELLLEEIENDGWQNLDWHDWRLATKDKKFDQYMEKQVKEALSWYYQKTGEKIPGYDRNKKFKDYDKETAARMNEAIFAYLGHVDEVSGLKGSENFARKNLMYREDLPAEEIEMKYKDWEERELHHEEIRALK